MTKLTIDAETRARLKDLGELLELCDESGRTLGYFHPSVGATGTQGKRVQSPINDAEIERRRSYRRGRPLSEILNDLATGKQ